MNVSLYRQNVGLARSVQASSQEHDRRSRLFLRLEDQGVSGFGEVAPQPFALNGDPSMDDVVDSVRYALARLSEVVAREGSLPRWSRIGRLGAATPARNAATALLEMALLDRGLRQTSTSIGELWPEKFDTPTQVTMSLNDEVEWSIDDSVARVRLKSAPGPITDHTLERLSRLGVPVLLDFNCSATSDEDVLAQVKVIRDVATISAVEQPYKTGNVVDHARLASRLDVPLSIDEGVRSARDLAHIANYRAASMICIKPARVGGLANARDLFTKARDLGLMAYLGGFFESPYARGVHRALAHSCVSEPSDLLDVEVQPTAYGAEAVVVESSFGVEPADAMLRDAECLLVFS